MSSFCFPPKRNYGLDCRYAPAVGESPQPYGGWLRVLSFVAVLYTRISNSSRGKLQKITKIITGRLRHPGFPVSFAISLWDFPEKSVITLIFHALLCHFGYKLVVTVLFSEMPRHPLHNSINANQALKYKYFNRNDRSAHQRLSGKATSST